LVTNLLDNAVLHSGRADVTVEVGAQRRADGSARVWVCDDGRGVPPEDRERVFGVFERLDERPRPESGTGIGLAACRKIVEQFDASIRLADVQNGACVEMVFPAEVVRWPAISYAVAQ
jgi:signal transduction histidine kinase